MNSLAEDLRDEGMGRALETQERRAREWGRLAYEFLEAVSWSTRDKFTAEAVREYAERGGLSTPPEPRAWGSIFRKAVIRGLIEPCGWARSKNPKAHTRPVTVWRRKAS